MRKEGMELFERFATQGVYFQAFMIASGSLVVLRAPFQQNLSSEQIQAFPAWARWLLRMDQTRLHRRVGWFIIGWSAIIAALKVAHGFLNIRTLKRVAFAALTGRACQRVRMSTMGGKRTMS